MTDTRPDITPDLKVGALLAHYPELEDALIALSPEFRRLKNPVLRATVAKLATLRQVAQVGGVPLGTIITTLRRAAGVEEAPCGEGGAAGEGTMGGGDAGGRGGRPDWMKEPARTLDARAMIDGGGHPLPQVMEGLAALADGEVFVLVTPFVPSPLVGVAEGKGYAAWTDASRDGEVRTYFTRRP